MVRDLKAWGLGVVSALAFSAAFASPAAFDAKRCVNMGNSFDAPAGVSWGGDILLSDFAKIKSVGFDTVRIPVRWSDYTGPAPDYMIDPSFFADVKAVVDEALAQDLNVVLNIHHFEEIMVSPRDEFRRLVSMWRQIATVFASAPDDLWFETLNEPKDALSGKLMKAAQTAAVLAIRETNPDRIIILGGDEWSGINSLGTNIAPPDENIVYTFHYYDPFDFTHQYATWLGDNAPKKRRGWGDSKDREELERAVEKAVTFRDSIERPVFLGEFGVNDPVKSSDRVEWAGAVSKAMEEAGIPWCLWAYANTFSIYDRKTGWDEDMVEALGLSMPDSE